MCVFVRRAHSHHYLVAYSVLEASRQMKPLSPRQQAASAALLQLKKVRRYLSEHPGSTCAQVVEVVGHGLMELQSKGLAYWKREDGVVKWYSKDQVSRPWTEKYQEEAYEETNPTRWEEYKP